MADAPSPSDDHPIISEFADDPEMVELVRLYVSEMPERVRNIWSAWQGGQIESLTRLAHQLKGASAGYGFGQIGEAAARLEASLRALESEGEAAKDLDPQVRALVDLCERARG